MKMPTFELSRPVPVDVLEKLNDPGLPPIDRLREALVRIRIAEMATGKEAPRDNAFLGELYKAATINCEAVNPAPARKEYQTTKCAAVYHPGEGAIRIEFVDWLTVTKYADAYFDESSHAPGAKID